jgi:hypothetical protein
VDAANSVFFTNQLTNYDPKIFESIKTPLTAFEIFPIKAIDPAMTNYSYSMYDGFGKSKYGSTANGKNNDQPYVGVNGEQFVSKIDDVYCAIAFSRADLAASRVTQIDYVQMLQRQAWRSNYEAMNKTCFFGNKEAGLAGLLNNPFVRTSGGDTAVVNTWANSTTTGIMIYDDFMSAYNTVLSQTQDNIAPNMALCSPTVYNLLSKKTFSSTFNAPSIKDEIEGNNNIIFKSCPELRSAFSDLLGNNKDGFILLNNDSDFIEHVVAEAFTILPPEARGLSFESLCVSRHGGLVIRQPLSIVIRRMA